MRLKSWIFAFIVVAFAAVLSPVGAQPANEPSAASPAATAAPMTPEEARRALDLLQDDTKRGQAIDALRVLANVPATPAVHAPPDGAANPGPPGADQKDGAALARDGLGAQLLLTISGQITATSRTIAWAAKSVTHVPALWHWITRTSSDPRSYDVLIDIVWKLAAVFACALAAEWLVARLLRRPLALLKRRIPSAARAAPDIAATAISALPPGTLIEPEQRRRHIRLARLWQSLVRLPFIIGCLVAELLPIVAFVAVGISLLSSEIGDVARSRLVVLALVNAYALCRAIVCVVRTVMGPSGLLTVRAETAAYTEIWTKRIVTVAVLGVACANVALLLGLNRPGYLAIVRLVMLVVHVFAAVIILQCRRPVARAIRAGDGDSGMFAAMRNRLAAVWHYLAIAVVMALWVVWALNVKNGYGLLLRYFVGTVAVILITRIISMIVLGMIDRGFRINPEILQRFPGLETRANRYLPLLRKIVSCIIALVGGIALLQAWGVDALVWFYSGQIGSRLLSAAVTIGVAVVIAAAVWEASNAFIDHQLVVLTRNGHFGRAGRLRTFKPMLRTALLCIVVTVVALTALSEMGVNIAPLLAGAGIVGIAIGFGSQKLVQDVITGLFLLLENVVQVGDNVTVSGLTGIVENLSIRTIRLRAGDGAVHIVPFSAVTSVTNASRGAGNAAVSVNVAYKEDTDRASQMLKEIVAEMRREEEYRNHIRSDLELWGVDKVDGAMVSIVGQIRCTDGGRWAVQREFNRRMKRRFQDMGIEIASGSQTFLMPVPVGGESDLSMAMPRRAAG